MWRALVLVLLYVASSAGQGSTAVRLPPNILVHPESVQFRSEDKVELLCEAEGVPAVEYFWERDGQRLEINKPNLKWMEQNKGSIIIDPISSLDEGYYQCFATNQYGKALSNVANVRRSFLEFDSSTDVKEYRASVGEYLMLPCDGYVSHPTPQFSWAIAESVTDGDPVPVSESDRIQVDLQGNLHFANIQKSDEQGTKIYKCNVFNPVTDRSAGGSYSKIKVEDGTPQTSIPEITYSTGDQVALKGGKHVQKCIFKGYTTPKIVSWIRESGKQLPVSRSEISQDSTVLTITNVQMEDADTYICKASNSEGQSTAKNKITVQSRPTFKRSDPNDPTSMELRPMNLNRTEKESASFFCSPQAVPNATIQWLINGEPISNNNPGPRRTITDGGTKLTVIDLCKNCLGTDESDLIVVQCNISNKHGYNFSQGYLNVLESTVLTVKPEDVTMEAWDEPVVFECNAKSDDSTPFTIIWKHKGIEIDTRRIEYEVKDHNLHVMPLEVEAEERGEVAGTYTYILCIHIIHITCCRYEVKDHNLHVMPLEVEAEERGEVAGTYTCEASNGYGTPATHSAELTLPVVEPPPVVKPAGFNILDYWWIFLIILIIITIILLCICCYCCYQRNKGDEYLVDEKDRKSGHDPEKELADSGFHDFQRPEEAAPFKGSRASLTSTIKLDTDDETSLLEYGEPDTGKFNEDGSFIGQYHDKGRRYNDSTV